MKREKIYSAIFVLAGIYNLLFMVWLLYWPDALFGLFNSSIPFPLVFIIPLSIGILLFGVIYFYIAWKPKAWLIRLSLLGKSGPPLLMLVLIIVFNWPSRLYLMVIFNDLIWWVPFFLFLRSKTATS